VVRLDGKEKALWETLGFTSVKWGTAVAEHTGSAIDGRKGRKIKATRRHWRGKSTKSRSSSKK